LNFGGVTSWKFATSEDYGNGKVLKHLWKVGSRFEMDWAFVFGIELTGRASGLEILLQGKLYKHTWQQK
jgi:hypothetical protein